MTGEYRMTMDPSEKDALLYVPGAGLTMMEQMDSPTRPTASTAPTAPTSALHSAARPSHERVHRLEQFAKLQRPPQIKFKDLEAAISSRLSYNILPMKTRVDFFPVTDASVLTNVTLQFDRKDLQFQFKDGVQKAVIDIYAKFSTMTGAW